MLSMTVSAILAISYKYILNFYSPFSLYLIRAIGVAILLSLIYKPKIKSITKKQVGLFSIAAILYSGAAIFQYYAISSLGISITVLVLTLSPAIIYFFSRIILKEKLTIYKIISSIIILACVLVAYLFL